MGSIMMHLCISELYRKKHNLSDKFMIGSILPDIYKKTIMTKDEAHYIKDIIMNNEIARLPDLDEFIKKNKEKNKDEVTIGYFAHLIEDYIWFKDIIIEYVKESGVNEEGIRQYRYKRENYEIVHDGKHFTENIYADYSYLDGYLIKAIPVDIDKIKNNIKAYLNNDEKMNQVIDELIFVHKPIENRENYFVNEEIVNQYIDVTLELLEKKINEFIS